MAGTRFASSYGAPSGRHSDGGGRSKGSRHTSLWVVLGIVVGLILIIAMAGGCLALSAKGVVAQAKSLTSEVDVLQTAIEDRDITSAKQSAAELEESVKALSNQMGGAAWSAASLIPVYGTDISGARELLDVASDLLSSALDPALDVMEAHPISSLMVDGAVDGEALAAYCDLVTQVTPVLTKASERVEGMGSFKIEQLNDVLEKIKEPLATASQVLESYGGLISSLPELMGCDGSRTYLVIAQNNAEIRATGGFPGAWGTVTVDNGSISMGGFTTIASKRDYVFDLTDEEIAAFGEGMATSPANLNYTPDFPRAASLLSTAWEVYAGEHVDGVIAADPVFLQRMLDLVHGSVTASDGTVVDGTNAAQVLLNDTYWRLSNDGEAQDAFFAEVASMAVDQVKAGLGEVDKSQMLQVMGDSIEEGRLLVWSADADVQAVLENTGVAGSIPSDPSNPVLGVYVNDNTWAKMCWYLHMTTDVSAPITNADGTQTYEVTTTFGNSITPEEAEEAPAYITGTSPAKRSVDDMYVQPLLLVPAGGSISDIQVSNGEEMRGGTLYGFSIWTGGINLAAQEQVTISYKVTTAAGAAPLAVHQTPLGQE